MNYELDSMKTKLNRGNKYSSKKINTRMVKAKDLKVGMVVLVYDEESKVTDVVDNEDGTFTIGFSDSGTEFDANDKFEVK